MKIFPIRFSCASIVEYSHIFMIKHPHKILEIRAVFWYNAADSLEDFPDISEVKCIVRFRRCWKQIYFDLIIHEQRAVNEFGEIISNFFTKFLKEETD